MSNPKPWYLSRTIWASIIPIVLGVAGLFGLPVAGLDHGSIADTLVQALTAISGIVAIQGRIRATRSIIGTISGLTSGR